MSIAMSRLAGVPTDYALIRRPADSPSGLACWLALPPVISKTAPPIVAVHGIRRRAREQAELLARRAFAAGRPVIAPVFDADRWPRYQQVVRRGRADLALLSLLDALRREGIWRTRQVELSGFSGGAQFAHRFTLLHSALVTRLTTTAAGWYTFPDRSPFPYGLAPRLDRTDPWAACDAEALARFLRLPIQVCVGADDNVRDANTRRGREIDAQQGRTRLQRATRWAKALEHAALELGIQPRVTFIALSACGHSFRQCVERGGLDRIVVPDAAGPSTPLTDIRWAS